MNTHAHTHTHTQKFAYVSGSSALGDSHSPGVLVSLGIRHRTKWGWVLLRLVISLFRFSWGANQNKHSYLSKCFTCKITAAERGRGWAHTLNTADTVWKEDPFFFPPFLLPPESPGDRHRAGVRWAPRTSLSPVLKVLVFSWCKTPEDFYLFVLMCLRTT